MRVRTASVLGVFAVLAAGCTTGGHALPAPLPPVPAAARPLVAWSQAVCTSEQSLQGLASGIDEVNRTAADPAQAGFLDPELSSYVSGISSRLGQARDGLKAVTPSGVQAADTHVTRLVQALDELGKKAPASTTAQPTLAQARDLAKAVAGLEPGSEDLTKAVRSNAKLNASFNVAPACRPVRQFGPADPAAPTRALVAWSDTVCAAADSAASLKATKIEDLLITDPRYARFSSYDLGSFLQSAGSGVADVVQALGTAEPTGIPAADHYRDSLRSALQAVQPKLPAADASADLAFRSVDELKPPAQQAIGVLTTITLPSPDLPAIARATPVLAHSHDVAPRCRPLDSPPATLPPAADGSDPGKCASGKCQVLVTGQADFTVAGQTFTISVAGPKVRVLQDLSEIQAGPGGTAQFGTDRQMVTVRVTAVLAGKAVVDISTQ
ncbi:hypothetical protein [Amycolatopsis sp. NPDC051903]|uniref:hypothetical protein n=1 Tax=Amycolatopsis sp. NPDC051903 TaxID=3363936 RepID=UPI00378821D6